MLRLKAYLEEHYRRFDYGRFRERDPIRFLEPHRNDPRALEVAGFLAAALAYGRVGIILGHLEDLFLRLGDPLAYVRAFEAKRAVRDLAGFKHRFNDGRDVAFLLGALRAVLERHGTLEDAVLAGMGSGLRAAGGEPEDIAQGLARLTAELAAADPRPVFGRAERPRSTRFLFASPEDGSTCKRLLMFARWMVRRPDAVCPLDFGVWTRIPPRLLLLPLDTHTSRLVRYLGLVPPRRSPGLAMAREATAALARLDPEDPVKYDFALAHIGICGQCKHRRVAAICGRCALEPVCRVGGQVDL